MNSKDKRIALRRIKRMANKLVDIHVQLLDELESGKTTFKKAREDAAELRALLAKPNA